MSCHLSLSFLSDGVLSHPVPSCLASYSASPAYSFPSFYTSLFFFKIFPFLRFHTRFSLSLLCFQIFLLHPFLFLFLLLFFLSFLFFFFARPTSLTTGLKVQLRVRRKLQELTTPRSPKIDGVHPDGVVHSPFGRLERFTEVFDATPAPLGGILHDQ